MNTENLFVLEVHYQTGERHIQSFERHLKSCKKAFDLSQPQEWLLIAMGNCRTTLSNLETKRGD
jgi:hypothetical protein